MADAMQCNKDDEERNTRSMKTRRKQGMMGRRDDERRGWVGNRRLQLTCLATRSDFSQVKYCIVLYCL